MVGIQTVVGEKGQVVIPKPIRDLFHIQKNTGIIFDVEEDRIILMKKKTAKSTFEEFINVLPKKKFPKKIDWSKEYYSELGE